MANGGTPPRLTRERTSAWKLNKDMVLSTASEVAGEIHDLNAGNQGLPQAKKHIKFSCKGTARTCYETIVIVYEKRSILKHLASVLCLSSRSTGSNSLNKFLQSTD